MATKESRARGVKRIVIDPRCTSHAEKADIHARLSPCDDGALALGLPHVIIKPAAGSFSYEHTVLLE